VIDIAKTRLHYNGSMISIEQSATFRKWEARLKDRQARILRLAEGLAGDVMPVGDGISELRIHYGPSYRVYFKKRGNTLIVLLCGGDKSSQRRDIQTAKQIAKQWVSQS